VIVAAGALALIGVLVLVAIVLSSASDPQLAAPDRFTAFATPNGVSMSWNAVKSADHYAVYRDDKAIASNVSGTTYTDADGELSPHSYYVVAVSAKGKEGDKTPSVPTVPDTTVGQPTPSPSTSGTLSPADLALANRLPTQVADTLDCEHYTGFTDAATIASVSCATSTSSKTGTRPRRIYAYQDSSPSAFKTHFATISKPFNPTSTDCAKPPAKDTWFFDSDKNTTVGEILCYTDTNAKKPTIQWTYDADAIAILAVAPDLDAAALSAWWDSVGLRLR